MIATDQERAQRVNQATCAVRDLICHFAALVAYHAQRGERPEAEAARDGLAYAEGVRLCIRDLEK